MQYSTQPFFSASEPTPELISLFELPLSQFKSALFGFINLTVPENKNQPQVKFMSQFVKNKFKQEMNEITESKFHTIRNELYSIVDSKRPVYEPLHLLELEQQAFGDQLQQGSKLFNETEMFRYKTLRQHFKKIMIKEDRLKNYLDSNKYTQSTRMQPNAVIANNLKTLANDLVKTKEPGMYFALLFQAVKNYIEIYAPEALGVPISNTTEYYKALRIHLLKVWSPAFLRNLLNHFYKIYTNVTDMDKYELTFDVGITTKNNFEKILVLFMQAYIVGFTCSMDQIRVKEEKLLVFPKFEGILTQEAVYAKGK
ncbi:Hypothetical_protein [Hexamita inflata]|uniref:Hypothetical_protein n=1 Tax=Hexamita inflata TaxID=28002 RepID=A0AA86TZZ1_9EUKA|nr:Hypothetical protein HINF_LOCUS22589 [Hexamita inflata]